MEELSKKQSFIITIIKIKRARKKEGTDVPRKNVKKDFTRP